MSTAAEAARSARDVADCEKALDKALTHNPTVKFMLEAMKKAGCPLDYRHFKCEPCAADVAGGFCLDRGIVMCSNANLGRIQLQNTLTHELLHAYDHCRARVDWRRLTHHACSEIRAANLSGDCSWAQEVSRGNFNLAKQHAICVRRRALLSVELNPSCKSREEAEAAVDQAWASCYADTAPFDRVP